MNEYLIIGFILWCLFLVLLSIMDRIKRARARDLNNMKIKGPSREANIINSEGIGDTGVDHSSLQIAENALPDADDSDANDGGFESGDYS